MNRFGVSAEYTRSPQSGLMGLWNRNVGWSSAPKPSGLDIPQEVRCPVFHVLKNEER